MKTYFIDCACNLCQISALKTLRIIRVHIVIAKLRPLGNPIRG